MGKRGGDGRRQRRWSPYRRPDPGARVPEPPPARGPASWSVYDATEQDAATRASRASRASRGWPPRGRPGLRLHRGAAPRLVLAMAGMLAVAMLVGIGGAVLSDLADSGASSGDTTTGQVGGSGDFVPPALAEYEPNTLRSDGPGGPLTVATVERVLADLRERSGSTLVTEATFYRNQVVLEVPAARAAVRVLVWTPGRGLRDAGTATPIRQPFDLSGVDPQLIVQRGRQPDDLRVQQHWVIVRRPGEVDHHGWLTVYSRGYDEELRADQHYLAKIDLDGKNTYLAAWEDD